MVSCTLQGSLNWTTWQLAGYCNWLEIRVVTRFDRGFAKGSTRIMSECAAIMAQFKAERMLIQVCVCACVYDTRLHGQGQQER